jgi:plastocyanin
MPLADTRRRTRPTHGLTRHLVTRRVNNKGFPHNVVFDEDAIPAGTSADALSHEDYLNAAGDSVSTKFDVAGTYGYYCEPHQGAGMTGKIIVQ